jgi:AcrR family transcriptional regulator
MPTTTFFNLDKQKKETIIDAAIDEFSNNTFLEASVNRIIEKASISKGSLYQYFEDKKDLYLYLIEVASQKKLDYLQKQSITLQFDDFFDGFEQLMLLGTQFSLLNPQLSKLVSQATQGKLVDESIQKMQEMNRNYLIHLVEQAKDNNQINPALETDMVVFMLNVVTTQFHRYLYDKYSSTMDDLINNENIIDDQMLKKHIHDLIEVIKNGMEPEKEGR